MVPSPLSSIQRWIAEIDPPLGKLVRTLMSIIDTHAHLDHLEGLQPTLARACEVGVEAIITVGVDLISNQKNLEIRSSNPRPKIFLALGIHPGNIKASEIEETMSFIQTHIHEAIAIGETGLDYWYKWVKKDQAKKEEQRQVFHRQLELAKQCNLPVIIHSRGAWRDCLNMAREAGVKKAVFHWYSGPRDVLEEILDSGYFISCTPSLAYSQPSREAIAHAPISQTLIETDSPVFYTEGEAGFKSEPKDVIRSLQAYAALKGMDQDRALETFNQNARSFFDLT